MSVKIMALVWELDLPPDEKIVLLAFADHADDNGMCFPSVARVAWKCAYSVRSVQSKLVKLRDAGLLIPLANETGGKPGSSTLYRVVPEAGHALPAYTGANSAPLESTGAESGETGAGSSKNKRRRVQTSAPESPDTTEPPEEPSSGASAQKAETTREAVRWMHELWLKAFTIDPAHPITLTAMRRQKYQAMFWEHLQELPDPKIAFRCVLRAVQLSDHHMSKVEYQMPESLFSSPERRSTWVQKAIKLARQGNGQAVDQVKYNAVANFVAAYERRHGGRD